ncbi:MAG: rRNA pseudouridine synthase [Firmicutes bacterium]|nr:rRNA pseudouridine synthase [Bacillota bacterium]
MRINRYLAQSGVASRRRCEELVTGGLVTVNDLVVRDLATQVSPTDVVKVSGKVVKAAEEFVYVMLNKPKGYVTTCNDEHGRKTVMSLVPNDVRLFPVGRLDYDTTGLLILTNDGEFTKRVTHPSSEVGKTYVVKTSHDITPTDIEKLCKGVMVDEVMTSPAQARALGKREAELVIHEGRNRQVRRMFEALGLEVVALRRVAVGSLTLGPLKVGEYRIITKRQAYSII